MNSQTPITHSIIFRQKHTNTTIPIKGQDRETGRIIANAQQQNPYRIQPEMGRHVSSGDTWNWKIPGTPKVPAIRWN